MATVLRQAFAEYARAYTPEAFAATTPSAERILERWAEGPVWVGTVAAVAREGATHVRSLPALPGERGRGLGQRLLAEVERFAPGRGHRRLVLSTVPFLTRAIRLYEQFGFQPSPDGPRDLSGTPLLTLVKPLRADDGGA